MPGVGSPAPTGSAGKTYYLPEGLHPRLKAAWWATQEQPTLGALVAEIFDREASRLEAEYNMGHPFPPASSSLSARAARGQRLSHSYYIPIATHARLTAAWAGTRDLPDAAASVSDLVARLLEAEAERLESAFNGGQPFPAAPQRARGVDPEAARRQSEKLAALWRKKKAQSNP